MSSYASANRRKALRDICVSVTVHCSAARLEFGQFVDHRGDRRPRPREWRGGSSSVTVRLPARSISSRISLWSRRLRRPDRIRRRSRRRRARARCGGPPTAPRSGSTPPSARHRSHRTSPPRRRRTRGRPPVRRSARWPRSVGTPPTAGVGCSANARSIAVVEVSRSRPPIGVHRCQTAAVRLSCGLGCDRQFIAQWVQRRAHGVDDQLVFVPVLGRLGQCGAVGGVDFGIGRARRRPGERPARDAFAGARDQQFGAGAHQCGAGVVRSRQRSGRRDSRRRAGRQRPVGAARCARPADRRRPAATRAPAPPCAAGCPARRADLGAGDPGAVVRRRRDSGGRSAPSAAGRSASRAGRRCAARRSGTSNAAGLSDVERQRAQHYWRLPRSQRGSRRRTCRDSGRAPVGDQGSPRPAQHERRLGACSLGCDRLRMAGQPERGELAHAVLEPAHRDRGRRPSRSGCPRRAAARPIG